ERHLGADALHGLQQAEPLAFDVARESEQAYLVLAHMCLDRQRHRLALRRQRLQGSRGAMHHVADAVHVDDDEVLAVRVDDALELADHGSALSIPPPARGRSTHAVRRVWGDHLTPSPTPPLSGGASAPSVPLIWLPLSRARSRDGARASPRSPARRRRPRTADRPWA